MIIIPILIDWILYYIISPSFSYFIIKGLYKMTLFKITIDIRGLLQLSLSEKKIILKNNKPLKWRQDKLCFRSLMAFGKRIWSKLHSKT